MSNIAIRNTFLAIAAVAALLCLVGGYFVPQSIPLPNQPLGPNVGLADAFWAGGGLVCAAAVASALFLQGAAIVPVRTDAGFVD